MEPAKVFTAVALFNMLIMPLNAFPWVINGLIEAWVSVKRIEKLMQVVFGLLYPSFRRKEGILQ